MALLHSLWQGVLLALMAALALRLLARHGAAMRHTVGLAFLLAMVAVPAVGFARFWWQPATEVNAGMLPAMTAPAIGAVPDVFVQQSNELAAALSLLWLVGVAMMLLRQFDGWRLGTTPASMCAATSASRTGKMARYARSIQVCVRGSPKSRA